MRPRPMFRMQWMTLYGILPIVLVAMLPLAKEAGWHLTRFGLAVLSVMTMGYVALGAVMAYRMTQAAVAADRRELGLHD